MRRNIRISAVAKVGVSAKVLPGGRANVVVQIRGHRGCLVIRAREIVAEAARAGGPGDLGADGLGAADGGDVGTGARERRRELWCSLAVVGLTRCTDACGVRQWNGRCRDHAERHPPKVHLPVSPEDSRTEIPRNPNWPIMLQTRLAYFSGTVCVMVQLLKRLGGESKDRLLTCSSSP